MNQQIKSIIWLRADLHIYDNPALYAAAHEGACLMIYTLCREQWDAHDVSHAKQNLLARQLACLATELERLNIPLWVEDCGDFSKVPHRLEQVCKELGAAQVSSLSAENSVWASTCC